MTALLASVLFKSASRYVRSAVCLAEGDCLMFSLLRMPLKGILSSSKKNGPMGYAWMTTKTTWSGVGGHTCTSA